MPQNEPNELSKATFGAGCFWHPQTVFDSVNGVTKTTVGYMGGALDNPTYRDVCTGTTNHAEVVQVDFDPEIVSFDQLLDVFWDCHDPTQMNMQGYDVGTQYRSVIFYHSTEQKIAAEQSRDALAATGKLGAPIATQIDEAPAYWLAEANHQNYMKKRAGIVGYL